MDVKTFIVVLTCLACHGDGRISSLPDLIDEALRPGGYVEKTVWYYLQNDGEVGYPLFRADLWQDRYGATVSDVWETFGRVGIMKHKFILGHNIYAAYEKTDPLVERSLIRDLMKDIYGMKNVTAPKVMIDIGGYIGLTAIVFKKLYPNARVIIYEPCPVSRLWLGVNIYLNGLKLTDFEIHREALANVDNEERIITYNYMESMSASAYEKPGLAEEREEMKRADSEVKASTVTLETLLKRKDVGDVDFLKIACEGCEFEVMPSLSKDVLARVKYATGRIHPWLEQYFKAQDVIDSKNILCLNGWTMEDLECSVGAPRREL